jgi:hypothetical protein
LAHRREHVRAVRALTPTRLEQSTRARTVQHAREQALARPVLAQSVAKRAEHSVVKAGIVQSKAEPICPVDPGPYRLSRLAITQPFAELEHGDQGQTPGRIRRLTAAGVEIGEVRIIKHSPEPLPQEQVWIAPPKRGASGPGGVIGYGWKL